ncbi:MAG: hypothetical protein AAFR03_05595 [Pseudomonadota bacterium]
MKNKRMGAALFGASGANCLVMSLALADGGLELVAGLSVETVGVNRGQRSEDLNPAVTGFAEISKGRFYGGVVSTPTKILDEIRPLLLGYAGVKPNAFGMRFNVGARYYSFPDSSTFALDFDSDGVNDIEGDKGFAEVFAGAKRDIGEFTVGGSVFYTSNGFADSGDNYYGIVSLERSLGRGYKAKLHGAYTEAENDDFNQDYGNFAIGVYKTFRGVDTFARYSNTVGFDGPNNSVFVIGLEKSWSAVFGGEPDDGPLPPIHGRERRPNYDNLGRRRFLFDISYERF